MCTIIVGMTIEPTYGFGSLLMTNSPFITFYLVNIIYLIRRASVSLITCFHKFKVIIKIVKLGFSHQPCAKGSIPAVKLMINVFKLSTYTLTSQAYAQLVHHTAIFLFSLILHVLHSQNLLKLIKSKYFDHIPYLTLN